MQHYFKAQWYFGFIFLAIIAMIALIDANVFASNQTRLAISVPSTDDHPQEVIVTKPGDFTGMPGSDFSAGYQPYFCFVVLDGEVLQTEVNSCVKSTMTQLSPVLDKDRDKRVLHRLTADEAFEFSRAVWLASISICAYEFAIQKARRKARKTKDCHGS